MSVMYKLEPYDIEELKRRGKRKNKNRYVKRDVEAIVEEFAASEHDCCRVCLCDNDRKAHIECTILRRTVNIFNYDNIKVVLRGEGVYLVKKSKWEQEI